MIKWIIEFSVRHRVWVLLATAVLVVVGVVAAKTIAIDAIPDLSDTQVIVYSRWERSPQTLEDQVTYPIVSALMGTPKVKTVRGISDFGYSYVYVIFEDGTDLYWARSRVLERLNRLQATLPAGVATELGPDATSVGWIFQYVLKDESGHLSTADLRSLQDWSLRFQLQSVPGVAEVAAIGGFVKQLQIKVDPRKLLLHGVSFAQVMSAVRDSNQDGAGRLIEVSGQEAMVRSRGLVSDLTDLENAVVAMSERSRAPILVKQVAEVSWGAEMRRGVSDFGGTGDAVGGIIVMRHGEDANRVIERVKARLAEAEKAFPPGVTWQAVYDRSELIDRTLATLKLSLVEELLIVSAVILLFLWHLPSAIVPILTIPVAVLLAFIPLYLLGQTSNMMSLAGIAISIGVLVDGAIVEVENAYRRIQIWEASGRPGDFASVRLKALTEVGPSVFFSLLVIAVAFLPIFALVDQEGRLFRPLALSKNFAMAIAALLSITLDPALRFMFSRSTPFQSGRVVWDRFRNAIFVGQYRSEAEHPISRSLIRVYRPVLEWALSHRKTVLSWATLIVISTIPVFWQLGSEFMPTLHEGSLLFMPTSLPGLSVTEAQRILTAQNQIIAKHPEVETVFGKAGRAETATDTAPLSMIETTIVLKPKAAWRPGMTEEKIVAELNSQLDFIGMPNIWTMPIRNRIDMLATGIRSAVGLKILGPNLQEIEKIGIEVERNLKTLSAARTVIAERVASGEFLDVDFDRQRLQAYGLSLKDAQSQAMVAVGGEVVTTAIRGRERYGLQVRLAPDFRQDLAMINQLPIDIPSGAQVPLAELARVAYASGPSMIRDENAALAGYVFVDVDTSQVDLGGFVSQADRALRENLQIPSGYTLQWSGQFENLARVRERMLYILPIALLLIVLLLRANTQSWVKTGIVLLAIPFSLVGSVWLLWLLGYNTSLATWVGMIALLGLDAETGVFMLMYLDLAHRDRTESTGIVSRADLREVVIEGAAHRIRPKMMTVLALILGLVPIMWSTGAGSEVMRRIAAPMVGGLVSSFGLELLIYPVLYYIWRSRAIDSIASRSRV